MTTRPINDDDRAFITSHAQAGLRLLAHYGVAEPQQLSPAKVAGALDAWRSDNEASRPVELEVIRSLGCLLGFYIEKAGLGSWVMVTDTFGTTLGITHLRTNWVLYPLDVVSKRTKTGSGADLVSIVDVFADGDLQKFESQTGASQ